MNGLASRLALGLASVASLSAAPQRIFVGTYTETTSRGIYSLTFDAADGSFSTPAVAAETKNPGFLALDPQKKYLYTGDGIKGGLSAYAIDTTSGRLSLLNEDPAIPDGMVSHLVVDATGRMLLVANNTPDKGFLATYPIRADGSLGGRASLLEQRGPPGPRLPRQSHAHAHSVTLSPDNRFALVCDLGLDRVFVYWIAPVRGAAFSNGPRSFAAPPGAGPRHSKFSPDGRYFYVVDELGCSVCAYAYDHARGDLSLEQTIPTMPADFHGSNASAEVDIGRDGRYLYASNRGPDSLTVFARNLADGRLSVVERIPCGGRTPRFFTLSPDSHWLLCANQDSDTITLFRIDPDSGRLAPAGSLSIPRPTCIVFD